MKHEVGEFDVEEVKSTMDASLEKENLVIVDELMQTLPSTQTINDLVNEEVMSGLMWTDLMESELFVGDAEHGAVIAKREIEVRSWMTVTPLTHKHPVPTLN
jgi:hypothetical protein